jgi:hypothetical protein
MRKSPDNSEALAAYIARKTEIDTILARFAALRADHFNRAPDDVSWADVGTQGGEPSRYARRTPQNSGNAAFTISLISDRNAVGWNSCPSGMHGKVSSARI